MSYKKNGRGGKSSKSNGKKGNYKYGSKTEDPINSRQKSDEFSNHPEWLNNYPELAMSAGQLAFGHPIGVPFDLDYKSAVGSYNMPNIMTLTFAPSIGANTTEADAVNIAAKRLYTFIRAVNSGAKNYDPVDIMMYLLAMDQVSMCFEWIKRAFGSLNSFSATNRKFPETFVRAQGFVYQDLVDNKADMWFMLNYWADQMAAFVIPKGIKYFDRHRILCSTFYADTATNKSQFYIFMPDNFLRFDEKYSKGGALFPAFNLPNQDLRPSGQLFTWADAKGMMNSLIQPLLASEDILGNISGDILKAWGMDSLWKMEEVPHNYKVMAELNMDMLMTIRNATVLGRVNYSHQFEDRSAGTIWQDENGLIHQRFALQQHPAWYATDVRKYDPRKTLQMITANVDVPDSKMVNYYTRLTSMVEVSPDEGSLLEPVCTGSEIITGVYVDCIPVNEIGTSVFTFEQRDGAGIDYPNTELVNRNFEVFMNLTCFDYHPKVYLAAARYDENYNAMGFDIRMAWDFDNVAVVPVDKLKQVHDNAMMSYFFVPAPGKV